MFVPFILSVPVLSMSKGRRMNGFFSWTPKERRITSSLSNPANEPLRIGRCTRVLGLAPYEVSRIHYNDYNLDLDQNERHL